LEFRKIEKINNKIKKNGVIHRKDNTINEEGGYEMAKWVHDINSE